MPWWREASNPVSLARILVHVTAETHRHAGHADIVREMADGSVGHRDGNDNMAAGDPAWAPIAALNADRVKTRTLERFLHPDGRLDQDLFLSNSGGR